MNWLVLNSLLRENKNREIILLKKIAKIQIKKIWISKSRKFLHVKKLNWLVILGILANITEIENEKDGKTLRIQKGMIKDEAEHIEIILLSSLKDEISNNTSYDFKKMRVQKFNNDRILKSMGTTKVSKNDDVAIFVTEEKLNAFSCEKTVKEKHIFIDFKTLIQTYLCHICRAPVSINNAAAWREKWDNASSQSSCKLKADVDANIEWEWSVNSFMNNAVKWPSITVKSCSVHTARFLKYVRPFYNIMHKRVKI